MNAAVTLVKVGLCPDYRSFVAKFVINFFEIFTFPVSCCVQIESHVVS